MKKLLLTFIIILSSPVLSVKLKPFIKAFDIPPLRDFQKVYRVNHQCKTQAMKKIVKKLNRDYPLLHITKAEVKQVSGYPYVYIYTDLKDHKKKRVNSFEITALGGKTPFLSFDVQTHDDKNGMILSFADLVSINLNTLSFHDIPIQSFYRVKGHLAAVQTQVPIRSWNKCLIDSISKR